MDIDPMKFAGEGFGSTEEYFPQDVAHNPHVLGDVLHDGSYYPGPEFRKRR